MISKSKKSLLFLFFIASGTGKTVTLLSFILSYKIAHPDTGKLVYCSRTVGECEKALEEAKVVMAHIQVYILKQ